MSQHPDEPPRLAWRTIALIVGVAVTLYAIRVTGPVDLMDNDQLKPAHYVHDVVLNGNWIVQRDTSGDIASKPPLQVWIASIASLPLGRAYWFTLAIPSVLGVSITALVAAWFASRVMPKDPRAPLFAGLLVLLSMMGAKQVALVRTDALFGGTVALCALLAWTSSRGRTNWILFWFASALSTLTKGPVGPLIASFGLMTRPWRTGGKQTKPVVMHAIGVVLFLVIAGGWVGLAYLDSGQAFVDKVLGKELVGHAVESGKGDPPLVGFYKSPGYFLWWYAPAAPLALVGVWSMWKTTDERVRALVRYLGVWMLGGLLLFSLSPHQRADLLTPIWAPCGALAGCVLARWVSAWSQRVVWGAVCAALTLTFTAVHVHRHMVVAGEKHIVRAQSIDQLVTTIHRYESPDDVRLYNAHSYLEYRLGKMRVRLTLEEAVDHIASGYDRIVCTNANHSELIDALTARRQIQPGFDPIGLPFIEIDGFEIWMYAVPGTYD